MNDLENNRDALKILQCETQEKLKDYEAQIVELQRKIDDATKPQLTTEQLDDIEQAIENAVNNYDFDDSYNMEPELELSGNEISVYAINLEKSPLIEAVTRSVQDLFGEVHETTTDNS